MSGSTSTPVRVGDPVPLKLQLGRDEGTLFVQTEIRDRAGVLLAFENLTHVANGLYSSEGFVMPDEDLISATYRVFEDNAYLIRSSRYPNTGIDLFPRDEVAVLVDVISSQTVQGDLVGIVEEGELVGSVELDGQLTAEKVEEETLGVVEESDLTAQIEDTETAGIIE